MKFEYQARTKEGEIHSGIVEASSEEAVLSLLQKYGLVITSIKKIEEKPFFLSQLRLFERISKKEITAFCRQLAIMFKSDIPPVEALIAISKQIKNPNFKEKILEIAEEISGGSPLSKALASFPRLFSPFFINMVKSGEVSGSLAESIEYLADHLEKEENLHSQVKGAMAYPILVLIIFSIVLAMMVFFVIPRLVDIFQETGAELPLITKIVISFANFFRKFGWLLIIILIAVIFFLRSFSQHPAAKSFFDRIFLKIPLLRGLLEKIYLTRLAQNLSTLIAGGLPITQALEITAEVVGNEVYRKIIFEARDEVKKGETISRVLEKYPQTIPPLFIQMVSVGEKTGNLDKSLRNIVGFYQRETERTLNNFMRLLEPILIIFLGLIVTGLMAAIILPLYQRFAF